MLRAQLSLEFLIYLSLAGLSLLFAVGVFASQAPVIRSGMYYYATSFLVGSINQAIFLGPNGAPTPSIFLPPGMCNSSVSGRSLYTGYGKFDFVGAISLPPNVFCPDNAFAQFSIKGDAGNQELARVA